MWRSLLTSFKANLNSQPLFIMTAPVLRGQFFRIRQTYQTGPKRKLIEQFRIFIIRADRSKEGLL